MTLPDCGSPSCRDHTDRLTQANHRLQHQAEGWRQVATRLAQQRPTSEVLDAIQNLTLTPPDETPQGRRNPQEIDAALRAAVTTTPAAAHVIAERAHVSTGLARRHLQALAAAGHIQEATTTGARRITRYSRKEA